MKKVFLYSVVSIMLIISAQHIQAQGLTNDAVVTDRKTEELACDLVAKLYTISNPIMQPRSRMKNLMSKDASPALYAENGWLIERINKFGNHLIINGTTLPSPPRTRWSDQMSRGTSVYVIGNEMKWLAQVLPSAAQGNWSLYNERGEGGYLRSAILTYVNQDTLDELYYFPMESYIKQLAMESGIFSE